MVFARRFSVTKTGKVRAEREVISFSWDENTDEAKAAALLKVIEKMDGELPELDENPPLNWIPKFIKDKAKEHYNEIPKEPLRQNLR